MGLGGQFVANPCSDWLLRESDPRLRDMRWLHHFRAFVLVRARLRRLHVSRFAFQP